MSPALAAENTLKLPESLQAIEDEAFWGDTSLEDVILPDGVISIGEKAFAYSSLRHINLPASITFIAENAFEGCSLTYASPEDEYCIKWCADHHIRTSPYDPTDPYEGDPFTDF